MKKNLPVVIFLAVFASIVTFISIDTYQIKKAESIATGYYEALINENYEEALSFLAIRDEYIDEIKTETKFEDIRKIYLKKTKVLKENNYRISSVNSITARKVDGLILIDANLSKEVDGAKSNFIETLQLAGDKLLIDYSGDVSAKYRNGFMKNW